MHTRSVRRCFLGFTGTSSLVLTLVVAALAVVVPRAEAAWDVPVRFASYNVRTSTLYNGAWRDHNSRWTWQDARRMRRAAATMAAHHVTAVATQEMRAPERRVMVDRLEALTGHPWGATRQKQQADDTMVLFDKRVWWKVRQVHFLTPMQRGRKARNQVGVLLHHKQTKQRVWFYSVHYAKGKGWSGREARRKGARRTLRVIREHSNGHAFMVGGDFNEEAGGVAFRTFKRSGIVEYARWAAERRVQNHCKTYNGRAGSGGRQSCLDRPAQAVDHIWVTRRATQVHRHKVIATSRTSRTSDHNPVATYLTTWY